MTTKAVKRLPSMQRINQMLVAFILTVSLGLFDSDIISRRDQTAIFMAPFPCFYPFLHVPDILDS